MKISSKNVLTVAATAAGICFCLMILSAMLNIPDVLVSYSTNECVEVVNYTEADAIENYTCNNLPSKFNHVWVK